MDTQAFPEKLDVAAVLAELCHKFQKNIPVNAEDIVFIDEGAEDYTQPCYADMIADLLCMDLPLNDRLQVHEVLAQLISQAEHDLRHALSQKLSCIEGISHKIVLDLINDDIVIADPLLRNSPVLTEPDLLKIVRTYPAEFHHAIALREDLTGVVIDSLANTKDMKTAVNLNENQEISLTDHAMSIFAEMVLADNSHAHSLAEAMLEREELTSQIAVKIYHGVGEHLKILIRDMYDISDSVVDDAVDDILSEYDEVDRKEFEPSQKIIDLARQLNASGKMTEGTMMETLKRGQVPSFIAMFAEYCHLSVPTVMEMLAQEGGQGLAIACKATGIQKADFSKIYLLTHKVRSQGHRVIDQDTMARANQYFDKIGISVAQDILRNSRH